MIVTDEKPFSVPASAFGIGASASGYTLAYSADAATYTNFETPVPAGETCFVVGLPKFCYYKLVGNSGEVKIQW